MEKIDGKTATLSMLDAHTLLVTMKENEEVDLDAAIENYKIATHLTKGKRYASLVDVRVYVTITDEAKKYAAQPDMYTNVIAQAVVITSLATRLLANFLIKFTTYNKDVEMKIFNDYDVALKWLKEKVAEEQQVSLAENN
ncbi:MAG TPA: hypothetical protein VKG26_13940 [Bacteroidia bacterium]|nr:hypothetical protein [Bacteroidia bacterium]